MTTPEPRSVPVSPQAAGTSVAVKATEDARRDPLVGLSQAELRVRLAQRKANVNHHIDALRSEMTLADVSLGGQPLLDHVRRRPLLALGTGLAAGALVGLVFKLARRERPEEPTLYEAFRRAYARDLLDDAAHRVAAGEGTDAALARALRQRAPVVYVEADARPVMHEASTLDFLLKTAIGFGVKTALDLLTQRFIGEPEFFEGMEETSAPEGIGA